MNSTLLDAVLRLVRLLDHQADIPVLAPLSIREILYRVLQDEQSNAIKQFAMIGSRTHQIAKVIELITREYARLFGLPPRSDITRLRAVLSSNDE